MSAEVLTYDSLVTDIASYAERDDVPFTTQIPRLIMLAENRLCSEARGLGFQRYATGSFSANSFAKPARWRETVSINITVGDERKFLRPRTYDYCRAFWPNAAKTDVPRYYSDQGYEHFFVVPTPAVAYAFEVGYYERPEPLSSANQTNWTTQYAPQLLLYATLLEAQPFLKRAERIAEFQGLYDRALQSLAQETSRRISGDRAATTRAGE